MSIFRIAIMAVGLLATTGCVKLTIAWADLKPNGVTASPSILGAFDGSDDVSTIEEWETTRVPALKAALQEYVYGHLPDASSTTVLSKEILDDTMFDGLGILEEYKLQVTTTFNGVTNQSRQFYMNVLKPRENGEETPIILMQTFCPRPATIPHPSVAGAGSNGCGNGGLFGSLASYVFGRYIATPPLEEILSRGYALATIFPSEFMADASNQGLRDLRDLSEGYADDQTRWGTIAAWGWGYSRMTDVLEDDPSIGDIITYGHSRYGKAALVAAAFDPRIDGVIAHQSGTGGASLNVEKRGESVGEITESYPHWFSKTYASYAGREHEMPVDQHMLIALAAPRPVLFGNARRDVWSDPNGAFRAAIGADPVYELYGKRGLDQERLKPYDPSADLAFWIRPGTHGVVEEDWPAFFEFLDAHFKIQRPTN